MPGKNAELISETRKVEVFKEALVETHGTELNTVIWKKSKNCETWLNRRTNYSRSLAVMSIVGYILGLGDRHPSNLMMSRKTGKIIHIDFGDCYKKVQSHLETNKNLIIGIIDKKIKIKMKKKR